MIERQTTYLLEGLVDRAEDVAVVVVVDPPGTKVTLNIGSDFLTIFHHLQIYIFYVLCSVSIDRTYSSSHGELVNEPWPPGDSHFCQDDGGHGKEQYGGP